MSSLLFHFRCQSLLGFAEHSEGNDAYGDVSRRLIQPQTVQPQGPKKDNHHQRMRKSKVANFLFTAILLWGKIEKSGERGKLP